MKNSWPRQWLSLVLVFSFACASLGVEGSATRALLHASGTVQVNGATSRGITTLFSGDAIQTDEDSAANLVVGGSSVLVMPNASIKFLGDRVELTEGGTAIATSEGMSVIADNLTITPAAKQLSKFEVAEDDDSVVIAARQGNVAVSDGQQTSTVSEGQETKHKRKKKGGGAVPAANGTHAISGKTLAIVGGAAGGTVAGILVAESNKKKKCVSSSNNKKCKCKKDKNGNEDCEEDD